MKSRNENTVSMYLALLGYNQTVPTSIKASMPGYNTLFEKLFDKTTEIGTLNGAQGSSRVGFQIEKTNKKEQLVTKAMTIVFSAKAYAIETENNVLETQMKAYTKSKLLKYRDSKTADFVEEIVTIVTPLQVPLEPYGITTDLLTDINNTITTYRTELSAPRNSIVQRTLITTRIALLFKETAKIIYQLDTLVNSIKEAQPEFAEGYFTSRIIIDYHGSVLSLRGFIKDENGNPIQHVEVTATNGNRVTKTTDKGYYEFKNLPSGINTIKFSKVLFNETSSVVGIVKGERIQLDITLENKNTQSGAA